MKNKRGFTLVELLAVIAILAILLTIGGLVVGTMMTKARKKALGEEGVMASKGAQTAFDIAESDNKVELEDSACYSIKYLCENNYFSKGCSDEYSGSVLLTFNEAKDMQEYKFWISNGTYAFNGATVNTVNNIDNESLVTTDSSASNDCNGISVVCKDEDCNGITPPRPVTPGGGSDPITPDDGSDPDDGEGFHIPTPFKSGFTFIQSGYVDYYPLSNISNAATIYGFISDRSTTPSYALHQQEFGSNQHLYSAGLSGITQIGAEAFINTPNLVYIYIPKGVTISFTNMTGNPSMGILNNTPNLKVIEFEGTFNEWKNLQFYNADDCGSSRTIGKNSDNNNYFIVTSNKTIECKNGVVINNDVSMSSGFICEKLGFSISDCTQRQLYR